MQVESISFLITPAEFEQQKGDDRKGIQSNPKSKPHKHADFSPTTLVKKPWREYILTAVSANGQLQKYLHKAAHLHQGQSLILSGCFSAEAEMSAWLVCGGKTIPQPERN